MVIQKMFEQSGNYDLFAEFIETLVNDEEIPRKLRRQIWTLASTYREASEVEQICADIVASFQDSEDALDLWKRWQEVVEKHWPNLIDCPLKAEIDLMRDGKI
jgi:hypothetical protein